MPPMRRCGSLALPRHEREPNYILSRQIDLLCPSWSHGTKMGTIAYLC
ncbi:MAG: hypothetical protein OJF52_002673 [Nitrospira sp.]|nr:MAG: hypothetical protein OJF52_002673 [Nitrospira sp.]